MPLRRVYITVEAHAKLKAYAAKKGVRMIRVLEKMINRSCRVKKEVN